MPKTSDLVGEKYGRITIMEYYGKNSHRDSVYLCKCDCGKEKLLPGYAVKNGHTKSCGCIRRKPKAPIIRGPKNRFEIHGETTILYLKKSDGSEIETMIDTEDLVKAKQWTWNAHMDNNNSFYAYGQDKKKGLRLHRVIMGNPEGKEVDHINHNTLDNRKSNLRIVTKVQNGQNRSNVNRNNTSGYRNVSWDPKRKKWIVTIKVNRKQIYLGHFGDLQEAAVVATQGRREHMPYSVP